MGFIIWSPLFPRLRIQFGNFDDPDYEMGRRAPSQGYPPVIRHWGVPLKDWPPITRPPAIGKHHADPYAQHHSKKQHAKIPRAPELCLYSHKPEQLVRAIKDLCLASEAQNKALEKYRALRSSPGQHPEDPELFVQYFNVLDQIFFSGTLKDLCYIEFTKFTPERSYAGQTTDHASEGFQNLSYSYETLIQIADVRGYDRFAQDDDTRLHEYLETLMHECVHVFIGLYTCVFHRGCQKHYEKVIGESGHMEVWQDIAHHIEARSRELLDRPFNLERISSLCFDIKNEERPIPEQKYLDRWSFSPVEVRERLDLIQQRTISGG